MASCQKFCATSTLKAGISSRRVPITVGVPKDPVPVHILLLVHFSALPQPLIWTVPRKRAPIRSICIRSTTTPSDWPEIDTFPLTTLNTLGWPKAKRISKYSINWDFIGHWVTGQEATLLSAITTHLPVRLLPAFYKWFTRISRAHQTKTSRLPTEPLSGDHPTTHHFTMIGNSYKLRRTVLLFARFAVPHTRQLHQRNCKTGQ